MRCRPASRVMAIAVRPIRIIENLPRAPCRCPKAAYPCFPSTGCHVCRVAGCRLPCLNAVRTSGRYRCRRRASERGNHVMTSPLRRRRGLRSASRRSASDQPVALHERLLARPGDDARHDRSGLAILSDQFADLVAAGLAAGAGQAGLQTSPTCRSRRSTGSASAYGICNPLVRRADGVLRGHAGRVLPRAERLAGQGMARQGCAAARLDRDPDAKRRKIRRRDRALRQGQALRPGADAGHGRHAARQARLLADLRRRRTAGPADRHPCRQRLSQPADLGRLGLLPHRGLCRAGAPRSRPS